MSDYFKSTAPHDPERADPFSVLDEDAISNLLAGYAYLKDPAQEFPSLPQMLTSEPTPAAVLVPLLRDSGEWHALFTRRNSALPEHSGQVAFPGGRADPQDASAEFTALREAFEEIGLKPQHVRLLGRLQAYRTITNYLVTPIVGTLPWPYPLRPATAEVSRVFTIPLAWLADDRNYEERRRELPAPFGSAGVIYFQPYDDEVLWGASARIVLDLLKALKTPA